MFLFKPKVDQNKKEETSKINVDLEIITKLNQEFALSLDLSETLKTALKVIVARINAQAANIFLINEKKKKFQCIASLHQDTIDILMQYIGTLVFFHQLKKYLLLEHLFF